MTQGMNAVAPHHLPPFITPPGETDVFLLGCAIFLVVAVISLGSLYFRLHALPEHLSHGKASKLQFEVVSVMALLALFTHNNWFWVAALLLAIVPVPDFYGPLAAMAVAGQDGAVAPSPRRCGGLRSQHARRNPDLRSRCSRPGAACCIKGRARRSLDGARIGCRCRTAATVETNCE